MLTYKSDVCSEDAGVFHTLKTPLCLSCPVSLILLCSITAFQLHTLNLPILVYHNGDFPCLGV